MSHGTRPVREPDDETAARGSVSAYLDAVLRRASVPMETEPFRPDWADRPRSHKVYEGLPAFPLPAQGPVPPAPLASALDPDRTPAAPDPGLTLPALAGMLRHSYGWLSRRLGVNADPGQVGREEYERATWGRGSAAGGGLYPCEIYWVCGPGAGPLPGVYHYDQPAHALRRLAVGDASPRVREALCGAPAGSQFLLVTVRFWQNAFKYGEFSYHCVTMDLGCLLHTWQTWAKGYGIRLRPSLWFDEPDLDALLGLDLVRESVLAAVPLPWATPTTARPSPSPSSSPSSSSFEATASAPSFEVTATDTERSRTVRRFPAAERAHLAAAYDPRPRPAATALAAAAVGPPSAPGHAPADSREAAPLRLPAPTPLPGGIPEALTARRSSFGRFSSARPLAAADLAALLRAAGHGSRLCTDARDGAEDVPLTRLVVFVNHVTGVPGGAHSYDAASHTLTPLPGPPPHPFLQRVYTLNNHNLEQASAVLVVLARPHAVLRAAGPRGYRLLNAEVGAVAQATYLAAAALGTGCGAALGFDYEAMAERLVPGTGTVTTGTVTTGTVTTGTVTTGTVTTDTETTADTGTTDTDTKPLLVLMTGHERPCRPDFDTTLVPHRPDVAHPDGSARP